MVSKDKIIKSTIGAVIGVAAVAGMAGAANNSQPQQTIAPVVQPVTYSDCRTEEIPFETQYEGETGQYGYTETIKQQGVAGSKRVVV